MKTQQCSIEIPDGYEVSKSEVHQCDAYSVSGGKVVKGVQPFVLVSLRPVAIGTTPDPGDGWRIAEGEDWKDERCEFWSSSGQCWEARRKHDVGTSFVRDNHYRVPIDPAPKYPPVPEGWRVIDPGKDGPKRADDMLWLTTGRCWSDVCDDGSFDGGIIYIRRIEPTYRPFASAEEFRPHRDRWWKIKSKAGCESCPPCYYNDSGYGGETWLVAFEELVFDDGSPFGVEVSS